MNEGDYIRGERRAWLTMLRTCLRELGYDTPEASAAKRAVEREDVVQALRAICEEFGDNDWPDDLHLADVAEKHLARYLRVLWNARGAADIAKIEAELSSMMGPTAAGPYCKNLDRALRGLDR